MFDIWNWYSFMPLVHGDSNRWGLVHGDFHWGQMMYQDSTGALLLEDWETSGFFATPAVDLGTLLIANTDPSLRASYEQFYLPIYYKQLCASGNVDCEDDYTYERLFSEYSTYGFSHSVVRLLAFMV